MRVDSSPHSAGPSTMLRGSGMRNLKQSAGRRSENKFCAGLHTRRAPLPPRPSLLCLLDPPSCPRITALAPLLCSPALRLSCPPSLPHSLLHSLLHSILHSHSTLLLVPLPLPPLSPRPHPRCPTPSYPSTLTPMRWRHTGTNCACGTMTTLKGRCMRRSKKRLSSMARPRKLSLHHHLLRPPPKPDKAQASPHSTRCQQHMTHTIITAAW